MRELAPGVKIVPVSAERLGRDFRQDLDIVLSEAPGRSVHSLAVDATNGLELEPSSVSQLFLFALWLIRPTATHAVWRLTRDDDGATIVRQLDQFQFNPAEVESNISDEDLVRCSELLGKLAPIALQGRRLRTALVLSLRSCEALYWQASLVLAGAALEALLTYSTERGITKRLAKSFACLMESGSEARDDAYREFLEVYNYRSDLAHGRGFQYTESLANLEKLARCHRSLRRLWTRVLTDLSIQQALEEEDPGRAAFFGELTRGFHPPQDRP
jgi:hypothetical protein